ncbi:hypothetical protein COB72_01900 [bacterium]|nr:MAG: hypothetical protein COB72_01900 [bacterium]
MPTPPKTNAENTTGDQSVGKRMTILDPAMHDKVVINNDGDRFVAEVVHAVEACTRQVREKEDAEKGRADTLRFLQMIASFCEKHETIIYGILGIEYTGMVCEFITSGDYRDYEIADSMGDFALDVHDAFPNYRIAFHTFPVSTCDDCELDTSKKRSVIYHAQV